MENVFGGSVYWSASCLNLSFDAKYLQFFINIMACLIYVLLFLLHFSVYFPYTVIDHFYDSFLIQITEI